MIFFTDIKQGKTQKNIAALIAKCLRSFEGKRVQITIEKFKSKRSDRQNALWWVYMAILANETGHTKEEIHELCKGMFLKTPLELVNKVTGEVHKMESRKPTTTTLTKDEFSDLIAQLQYWASDFLNVYLPSPDEQTEFQLQ